jgi:transposase-like protein
MKSQWFEYKDQVIALRKQGVSMTKIERDFGVARSTLSVWFRGIELTENQRTKLMKNSADGWKLARVKAAETHRAKKLQRLIKADMEAMSTLKTIPMSSAVLDLAFAMLYLGEGAKDGGTSIASSNPKILRFVLYVLRRNYSVGPESIRCDLHLRMDQDGTALKHYWSKELNLPLYCFKYCAFDKRSSGKKTYDHYMGVCVVSCGNIAIQRKIISLYNLFCEKVADLESLGA